MPRLPCWLPILAILLSSPGTADAQAAPELGHDAEEWIRTDEAFELRVPRQMRPVRVFLGPTDVTDLFLRRGDALVYRPELAPLPRGESELVVYGPGWQELGRFPLRVLLRGGLEAFELTPRLDLEGLADLDSGGTDPPLEQERATLQFDLRQRAVRNGTEVRAGMNVVGVSEVEQALRFGERGEEADRVDLSSYEVTIGRDRWELGLGHVSFGRSRHLIQSHSSRGLRARIPLGRAAELRLGAANGSSIVGWDNLLGLDDGDHQILSGLLGFELLPSRPGALRLEATWLDGSVLPIAGFNEGEVNDAETSDGWSARLLAATPGQRFRLDAAWSESRFTNPQDPFLAQEADLVAVEPVTKDARFADLSWAVLRRATESGQPVELSLDVRHRRIDPLYRSVAAFVQADVEETAGDLGLVWGAASGQLSFGTSRDNLDDVPSILTTETRRGGLNVSLPFAQIGSDGSSPPSPWAPAFTWNSQRIHQFGRGVPVDSGFDESHVPDLLSWSHQAGLAWSGGRWNLNLSGSFSDEDNRQPGRESADFESFSYGAGLFFTPLSSLDLGIDLRQDDRESLGTGEESSTWSTNFTWTLRLPSRVVFTGNLSWNDSEITLPGELLRTSEDLVGSAQLAWSFDRRGESHGIGGQIYLRGAYNESDAVDFRFDVLDRRDGWKLTSGLNLSIQ